MSFLLALPSDNTLNTLWGWMWLTPCGQWFLPVSDSHRNHKAMLASYQLLFRTISPLLDHRRLIILSTHTSNFYIGVAERRKAVRRMKRLLKETRQKNGGRKKKDKCTNGEGGERKCKLESRRSKHELLKTPPLVTISFKCDIMTVCETIILGLQLPRATTKWSCSLLFSAPVWINAVLRNFHTYPYCHPSSTEGEVEC